MRNRVNVDEKTSRAIIQEIGERLREVVREDLEVPASLRKQINRLGEAEGQSPPIGPTVEHGLENKSRKHATSGDRSRFAWLWRRKG
jgi:hypothetical protein